MDNHSKNPNCAFNTIWIPYLLSLVRHFSTPLLTTWSLWSPLPFTFSANDLIDLHNDLHRITFLYHKGITACFLTDLKKVLHLISYLILHCSRRHDCTWVAKSPIFHLDPIYNCLLALLVALPMPISSSLL